MEDWQSILIGLGITFVGAIVLWWFKSVDTDKSKGVRLEYDSEKTAETLRKNELHIAKIEADIELSKKNNNSFEESLALIEQREKQMYSTLVRIEIQVNKSNDVYSDVMLQIVQSNNNIANAINTLVKSLKDHSK